MTWHKIDLGPRGKAGVEARYSLHRGVCRVYIEGSDHWYDWLLHLLPWIWWLEKRAAREIVQRIPKKAELYMVGGHSAGFAVGCEIDRIRPATVIGYGGKRPWRIPSHCINHRNRKDGVPFLPPWRPSPPTAVWDTTENETMSEAHQPRAYYEIMAKDGFR